MAQKRKSTTKKSASMKAKTTRKKSAAKRSKVTTHHAKSVTHKKPEQTEWFLSWFEEAAPKKKSTKSKSTKTKSKRKLSAKRK